MYELLGFLSLTKISYSVKINFGPKFDQFVPVLYFCHHVYLYQAYQQLNISKLYSFCTYLLVSLKLSFMALRISLKITKPLSQIGLEVYSTCLSEYYRTFNIDFNRNPQFLFFNFTYYSWADFCMFSKDVKSRTDPSQAIVENLEAPDKLFVQLYDISVMCLHIPGSGIETTTFCLARECLTSRLLGCHPTPLLFDSDLITIVRYHLPLLVVNNCPTFDTTELHWLWFLTRTSGNPSRSQSLLGMWLLSVQGFVKTRIFIDFKSSTDLYVWLFSITVNIMI